MLALYCLIAAFCSSVILCIFSSLWTDPKNRFVIDPTTAEVSVNDKLSEGQPTLVLKVLRHKSPTLSTISGNIYIFLSRYQKKIINIFFVIIQVISSSAVRKASFIHVVSNINSNNRRYNGITQYDRAWPCSRSLSLGRAAV